MPLEPIELLKERLLEMNRINCKEKEFLRLKKMYEYTISFLELYGFKKEYSAIKLSDEDIKRIKRVYKWGMGIPLSYQYNVSKETISAIVNKRHRIKKLKINNNLKK